MLYSGSPGRVIHRGPILLADGKPSYLGPNRALGSDQRLHSPQSRRGSLSYQIASNQCL